jgi:hypothetical protein
VTRIYVGPVIPSTPNTLVPGWPPETIVDDVKFTIDLISLDHGYQALDAFLAILATEKDAGHPWTTEEIMEWLLINPTTSTQRHLVYLALICATAMQRLV